jgi:hypothetical protein
MLTPVLATMLLVIDAITMPNGCHVPIIHIHVKAAIGQKPGAVRLYDAQRAIESAWLEAVRKTGEVVDAHEIGAAGGLVYDVIHTVMI